MQCHHLGRKIVLISTGKLRVLFAQRKPMKLEIRMERKPMKLEIRMENNLSVCTGDFRTSFSLSIRPWPGLGSAYGEGGAAKGQPDIDGFRGSAFSFYHSWDKRLLQEPGEGSGPSCSLERWHRPGGPSL